MAYDSRRHRVLLFGGSRGSVSFADMWAWDGQRWESIVPATSPPARKRHAMAYDSVRDRVVLFGGSVGPVSDAIRFDDVWEWDGTNWEQRLPSLSPAARDQHGMVFDPIRGRVVKGRARREQRSGASFEDRFRSGPNAELGHGGHHRPHHHCPARSKYGRAVRSRKHRWL